MQPQQLLFSLEVILALILEKLHFVYVLLGKIQRRLYFQIHVASSRTLYSNGTANLLFLLMINQIVHFLIVPNAADVIAPQILHYRTAMPVLCVCFNQHQYQKPFRAQIIINERVYVPVYLVVVFVRPEYDVLDDYLSKINLEQPFEQRVQVECDHDHQPCPNNPKCFLKM